MTKLTHSYVHGVSSQPLLGETIGVNFDKTVARWPQLDALIVRHQAIRWSWKQLQEKVNAFAGGLIALGLQPGETIGIWSPNNAEWVITQFASAKVGLILVNINPAYRLHELEFALNAVNCKALITASRFKSSDYIHMLRELLPELDHCKPGALRAERLPELRLLIQISNSAEAECAAGMLSFDEVAELANDQSIQRLTELANKLQFDDPINIQFTSGTTGTPKAATLTHHNIVNNAFFSARVMRFSEHDRLCIPVPMYHCFGMVLGTLLCATHGAAMVFPSAGFDARSVLEAVQEERCTTLHGVPTMFIAALEQPDFKDFDLTSLRTGIMAGAPCPIELMKRVMAEMHVDQITIGYGMTETGPLSFQTAVDDPIERRVASVGRVLPHTEVKIVDEAGCIVPPKIAGELLTRGYCVMAGYWNEAEKTATAIDSVGWMHSGDIATIDESGYCQIVGRLKDMLIRGGENIFPREIEEFLYQHPLIEEVEVFGVPDPKYGEEICAWIKLREGAREGINEDDIRTFCRGRIAHFKVPRYIRFVDAFPLTVTGKVQKFKMRERMITDLHDIDEAV